MKGKTVTLGALTIVTRDVTQLEKRLIRDVKGRKQLSTRSTIEDRDRKSLLGQK